MLEIAIERNLIIAIIIIEKITRIIAFITNPIVPIIAPALRIDFPSGFIRMDFDFSFLETIANSNAIIFIPKGNDKLRKLELMLGNNNKYNNNEIKVRKNEIKAKAKHFLLCESLNSRFSTTVMDIIRWTMLK